jgi:REP-associated tyrosine transposase
VRVGQRDVHMARALRIDEAGLTYHVWANGVNSLPVFKDADDKNVAVRLLQDEVENSEWCCLEYVVMTTHYHVLLRLRKPTLSSGFQRFNVRYAQYYNKKYRRRGHVFDGRFESRIADTLFARLELARYVARNPVVARMCDLPEQYPWSGYGATIGLYRADPIVDVVAALEPFGGSRRAYRRYMETSELRVRWGLAGARPQERPEGSPTPTRSRAAAG